MSRVSGVSNSWVPRLATCRHGKGASLQLGWAAGSSSSSRMNWLPPSSAKGGRDEALVGLKPPLIRTLLPRAVPLAPDPCEYIFRAWIGSDQLLHLGAYGIPSLIIRRETLDRSATSFGIPDRVAGASF